MISGKHWYIYRQTFKQISKQYIWVFLVCLSCAGDKAAFNLFYSI
jgi:hypothetical protein